MNWEAIGAIGEIVGAIAVVVTLGYLALQIRQNTNALRGSAHETATGRISNFAISVGSNPVAAKVYHSGLTEPEKLDAEQWGQFTLLITAVFGGIETTYWQQKRGNVDAQIWERWHSILRELVAQAGVQRWWETGHMAFTAEFTELVESELGTHRAS